ncbi:MAG: hypothetical protein IMF11_12470 [Proteobacteria bacterium]|nr:hypothetical protein [Pseudomonadota bacterium]
MSGSKSSPVRTIARAVVDPISLIVGKYGGETGRNVASVLTPAESYVSHQMAGKGKEWKQTTMGRWFSTPSVKMPESKGGESAQQIADSASDSAMMAAKEKEKKRLRGAAGRSSLIKTGGRGVLEPADVKKKKLLGQ